MYLFFFTKHVSVSMQELILTVIAFIFCLGRLNIDYLLAVFKEPYYVDRTK